MQPPPVSVLRKYGEKLRQFLGYSTSAKYLQYCIVTILARNKRELQPRAYQYKVTAKPEVREETVQKT